jgi:hypothetical protein
MDSLRISPKRGNGSRNSSSFEVLHAVASHGAPPCTHRVHSVVFIEQNLASHRQTVIRMDLLEADLDRLIELLQGLRSPGAAVQAGRRP